MTRDDIIRIARESDCGHKAMDLQWILPENLERFAALVSEAEREACAVECDEFAIFYEMQAREGDGTGASDHKETAAIECAEAIRARESGS